MQITEEKEFNRKVREENLKVKACPYCGGIAKLSFEFPMYGSYKAIFQCERCGHSLKGHFPVEWLACGNARAGLITEKSIAKGIFNLVEKWNEHAKEQYTANTLIKQAQYRKEAEEERKCMKIIASFEMDTEENKEIKTGSVKGAL